MNMEITAKEISIYKGTELAYIAKELCGKWSLYRGGKLIAYDYGRYDIFGIMSVLSDYVGEA